MKLKDSERGYLFVMRFYKKDMDQNRKLSLFVRTAGKYSNCILYTNIILYVFIFMYLFICQILFGKVELEQCLRKNLSLASPT